MLPRRARSAWTLVEKGYLASGPTGKSSAAIRQRFRRTTGRHLLRYLGIFETFDGVVAGDPGFVRTGGLLLASDNYAPTLHRLVKMQRGLDVKVQLLPPADLPGRSAADEPRVRGWRRLSPDSGYANRARTAG